MQRSLFPLPIFLLPGGATTLRIFEPRYVRMVSESANQSHQFVVCPVDGKFDPPRCKQGALVEINDFSQGEDGLLLLDVTTISLVNIEYIQQDDDGLFTGTVELAPHWESIPITKEKTKLSDSLRNIINCFDDLSLRYSNANYTDLAWVCQRWLELLPLPMTQKLSFFHQDSLPLAEGLIFSLLEENKIN